MSSDDLLRRAASAIVSADALVLTAGAGMGVDSGLPDFRGTTGFWRAYPLYEKLGLSFTSLANPRWFATDPAFAWGFYGHRLELYRRCVPHQGFTLLRGFAERLKHGAFVYTSNVDGQFQRAGFAQDRVVEAHGSIHHLQCLSECGVGLLDAAPYSVTIDPETLRAAAPLPTCPRCKGILRPGILMFGDGGWDHARSSAQESRLDAWLSEIDPRKIVVVECGAGTAIPTVRLFSEKLARRGATLVRINVREPEVPGGQIGLAMGALEALRAIDAAAIPLFST
jgi:NAD-dependent SIR2 family protein deacetylase